MRWFTSDLHFGHANIIKYCDRPFTDTDHMDAVLMDNWNERVVPDDEVYVLGDVVLGNFKAGMAKVAALNGNKFLIPGNHDRLFSGEGLKGLRYVPVYEEAGFTILPEFTQVPVVDTLVLACHFPYQGDSQDKDRYVDKRPPNNGEWLLHGHTHKKDRRHGGHWEGRRSFPDRMIHVGVDAWDYAPVAESTVAAFMKEEQ